MMIGEGEKPPTGLNYSAHPSQKLKLHLCA
jgi:hypothetical protein